LLRLGADTQPFPPSIANRERSHHHGYAPSAQERMEEQYRLAAEGHTFNQMISQISESFGLSVEDVLSPGKHPHRVKARSVAAYLAVRKLGMDGTAAGRLLRVGQSVVSRAVTRGEKLMTELDIQYP